MHRELGVGEYVPGCCAFTHEEGPEVRVDIEKDGGTTVKRWHTPAGSLTERFEWCPESYSTGHVEFAVKEVEDLAVLRYIYEHRVYRPCHDRVRELDRQMGTHGLPVVATHPSPMAALYKEWAGVMTLSFLLADDEEEVEATCAAMAAGLEPMWALTAEAPCGYVMLCENFTAEGMGGLFDRFFRNLLAEKIALFHDAGKRVLCHIDGTLRGLADRLPEVGVDCLDAVTPEPVGDVAVEKLRDLVGPEVLILGGLPGAMFAPPFTRKDMEAQVASILAHHKESGRFMFGVADQVPPNGDLELVRLVTEMVESEGRYA